MQVDRFVGVVVAGSVDTPPMVIAALQGRSQVTPFRVGDGEVVEAGAVWRRRYSAVALPGVQPDLVVAARREEGCLCPLSSGYIESERTLVAGDGAFEIGYLEVHMPDACRVWQRRGCRRSHETCAFL